MKTAKHYLSMESTIRFCGKLLTHLESASTQKRIESRMVDLWRTHISIRYSTHMESNGSNDSFGDNLMISKGNSFLIFVGVWLTINDASVHVIDDFPIPRNWSLTTGIDVGGESPWAAVPVYADEQGNLIVTNGFHNRTGRVTEVAQWIKRNLPWNDNRSTFVLDPENKVATVELSDYGIYAKTAIKDINPGLLRMEGYLHVQKHRDFLTGMKKRSRRRSLKSFARRVLLRCSSSKARM